MNRKTLLSTIRYVFLVKVMVILVVPVYGQRLVSNSVDPVFIRVVPSKDTAYLGEPVTVEYLICYKSAIIDPEEEMKLNFHGFYSEEIKPASLVKQEQIGGETYICRTLRKYLLIPCLTGELTLPPLNLVIKLNGPATKNDFFEQEELISKSVHSKSQKLTILPLPNIGNLAFSGAVGIFKLKSIYKISPRNDRILEVTLVLRGKGSLKGVDLDPKYLIAGIEIFNVKETLKDHSTESGPESVFELKCQLVANYKGDYSVPALNFTLFNPESHSYYNLSSKAFVWKVKTGKSAPEKREIKIRLITKSQLEHKYAFEYSSNLVFFLGSASLLLLVTGRIVQVRKRRRTTRSTIAFKHARKHVFRHLNTIEQDQNLDFYAFCAELTIALNTYLIAKDVIKNEHFRLSDLGKFLTEKGVPDSLQQSVTTYLEDLYHCRFGLNMNREKDSMLESLKTIVRNLENYLNEATAIS